MITSVGWLVIKVAKFLHNHYTGFVDKIRDNEVFRSCLQCFDVFAYCIDSGRD